MAQAKHQYNFHGTNYGTLAAAKRAAQAYANTHGEQTIIYIATFRRAGLGKSGGYYSTNRLITVKPKTTGRRTNPADGALIGARILGTVRNKRGKVTGLKLQLRPGVKSRTNPTGGTLYTIQEKLPFSGAYYRNVSQISASSAISAIREYRAQLRRRGNVAPRGTKYKAVKV